MCLTVFSLVKKQIYLNKINMLKLFILITPFHKSVFELRKFTENLQSFSFLLAFIQKLPGIFRNDQFIFP